MEGAEELMGGEKVERAEGEEGLLERKKEKETIKAGGGRGVKRGWCVWARGCAGGVHFNSENGQESGIGGFLQFHMG